MRKFAPFILSLLLEGAIGCGANESFSLTVDGRVEAPPVPVGERCNGLDDDFDTQIDEVFRDPDGNYVDDSHCGVCGRPCAPSARPVLEAHCELRHGTPMCAAVRCATGYTVSRAGRCTQKYRYLCLPCSDDDDCGLVEGARCASQGGEGRCVEPCSSGSCPGGYACDENELCVPESGSCRCETDDSFDVACALTAPDGRVCAGDQTCRLGVLSTCAAPREDCNKLYDDCDGLVDESYRDARGAYSLDIHHCGACGVDCTASNVPVGSLVCGGDAFAPSCVLACPDANDGLQPGDHVDGDRDIATGCECTLRSTTDEPGPVGASGEALDVNCDGADGIVVESFYVATDGNDTWPGSPTRPMRTVAAALEAAEASLASASPRPHVFVATGSYAEVVRMPSGVHLHGGYRRDYLALDPNGFVTEFRAPIEAPGAFGAVLELDGPTTNATTISWSRFVGADASDDSMPAVAAYLVDASSLLRIDGCEILAGAPGHGVSGARGASGASPATSAESGAPPRAAVEDAARLCVASSVNVVAGGRGGANTCAGIRVSGGAGGSPDCPVFATFAPDGAAGFGTGALAGGVGGRGGQDSSAPITGSACPGEPQCCGLADFTVPTDFQTPSPGGNGRLGSSGAVGRGCVDAFGSFGGASWTPGASTSGTAGTAGTGGGGGGGGGGTQFRFVAGACPFADGLGGGGGGGGAGGCGGGGGSAGTSGAPSVALLLTYDAPGTRTFPTIVATRLLTHDGGRGGDGGAGGNGGEGGIGAIGEEIPRALRTTPTLAGPFAGGRGGRGGDGGSGGGGGGGCGGPSVGIWIHGIGSTEPPIAAAYRSGNAFTLGLGGAAGRGGGGSASSGVEGGAIHVLTR